MDPKRFPGPGYSGAAAATSTQVAFWRERYRSDALEPIPLVGALLAWLDANPLVRSARPAVLWGDCGLHNLLHEDGEITAVLDWELAHVGDPLEDLGAAVWSATGVVDPEIIVAAYEAAAGVEVDRSQLGWFVGYAALTRGIMILNGVRSLVEDPDPQPSMMGISLDLLPKLLRQAAAEFRWPHPDSDPIVRQIEEPVVVRPTLSEMLGAIAEYLEAHVIADVAEARARRNVKTIKALLAPGGVVAGCV